MVLIANQFDIILNNNNINENSYFMIPFLNLINNVEEDPIEKEKNMKFRLIVLNISEIVFILFYFIRELIFVKLHFYSFWHLFH